MNTYENNQNNNINLIFPNNSNFPKFKDDIILMLSEIEEKLKNRYNTLEHLINSRINAYDSRLITIENKLNLQTTKITKLIIELEKCSDILPTEKKNSETLITHEIRINNLNKEISDACYKYDKIYLDNLLIPGQIGEYCRFKNAKECFNFLITQTASLNDYKEKMIIDFKTFKEKCDEYFKKVHNDIELNKEVFMKYTTEKSEIIMENCNEKINQYLKKLEEAKIENYSYALKLKESSDSLINETNKLFLLKGDILKNNNELKSKVQEMNNQCLENVSSLKIEFDKINRKFQDIREFIKNVRFKKNINSEITKNDIKNLENNLDSKNFPSQKDELLRLNIENEYNKSMSFNNSLPDISNKMNDDDNLNNFGLKIFGDKKIKPVVNTRKSLKKYSHKNYSLIINEEKERNKINEFNEKRSKSKENFDRFLPIKHNNNNKNNFTTIPKIKNPDNHLIYKMIKNEKGNLMKTSTSTYFKPKKGI